MRNDIAELYVITWSPSSESKIHDHPQVGCVMKVVQGSLQEDIYIRKDKSCAKFDKTNYLVVNSVGFKEGNDVLHKITNINNDNDRYTISIHIYSKPEYIQNKYTEIL
jgi:cysteine dioxygenase